MHYYIFQDIYEWAGKIRIINIEKSEPALGGILIEYSDCFDMVKDATDVLDKMNHCTWEKASIDESKGSPVRESLLEKAVCQCPLCWLDHGNSICGYGKRVA
ncbi:MAG: hypothetical protein HFG59_08520 [Lachnospiraceae bacterium]|nr:hypothetical protein [Lachnospiraceae bacterium]